MAKQKTLFNLKTGRTKQARRKHVNEMFFRSMMNEISMSLDSYIPVEDTSALQFHREDFDLFSQYVLKDKANNLVKAEAIQRSWTYHIDYCWTHALNPVILAPWRHGKTLFNSVGRVLFHIGRDTSLNIKVVCNDDSNATKRVQVCKKYIETDREYKSVFPEIQPDKDTGWSNHEISVKRPVVSVDASIQARGIRSTGVGGGANLLIFDDVVDMQNAIYKPSERKTIIDLYDNVWMSRLERRGNTSGDPLFDEPRIIFIGTRWHDKDLTSDLIQRSGYCTLSQAIADDMSCIESTVYNVFDDYDPSFLLCA